MAQAIGPGEHRIHYREVGDPGHPTLVLIQGLGLDGRFWFDMPETLAADPRQPWRVLVPDNRGVGRSAMPRRPWTMADMADDIAAMLDAAGVRHAVLAGISMGGMIAQQVALRHPERVRGLVLMATWAGLPYGKLPALRSVGDLIRPSLTGRRDIEGIARILLPEAEIPRAREHLSGWIALMREQAPTREAFFGQLGAVVSHSTGHRLGRIRVPTKVVTGTEDRLIPPVNSRRLAARIPGATLELLPGVAHAVPMLDRQVVRRNAADLWSDQV